MKSPAETTFDHELDQLELRIARRADELFRIDPSLHGAAAWEQAEKEVWAARLAEIESALPAPAKTSGRRDRRQRSPQFATSV